MPMRWVTGKGGQLICNFCGESHGSRICSMVRAVIHHPDGRIEYELREVPDVVTVVTPAD